MVVEARRGRKVWALLWERSEETPLLSPRRRRRELNPTYTFIVSIYIYVCSCMNQGRSFCMLTSCCVVGVIETCPNISSLWLEREDKVVLGIWIANLGQ